MALDDLAWWLWLAAGAALVWLGARLQRWGHALSRARQGRRHQRAGEASEVDAARWLRSRGYRVLERQPAARYVLDVEGQARPVEMSADLRVHDGQEEWIVEVKTGERGSRVGFRGTRRQLLEYQLAFGTQGVLLVDPTRQVLQRVRFPFTSERVPRAGRGWRSLAWALGAAAAGAWIWAMRR